MSTELYTCTGDPVSTSTVAILATAGDRDLYADLIDEAIASHASTADYRHAVGDYWSVWGTEPEVFVAAVNLGGELRD